MSLCVCALMRVYACVLVHACVYSYVIFSINDTPYTLNVASHDIKLFQCLLITIHCAFCYAYSITGINSIECFMFKNMYLFYRVLSHVLCDRCTVYCISCISCIHHVESCVTPSLICR